MTLTNSITISSLPTRVHHQNEASTIFPFTTFPATSRTPSASPP